MKRSNQWLALTVFAALASGVVVTAHAKEADEALAIDNAKISLSQAVAAAEQHVGGKATKADFDQEKGQGIFEVEVVKGQTVLDVKVDSTSGAVIAAAEDQSDHEDEDD